MRLEPGSKDNVVPPDVADLQTDLLPRIAAAWQPILIIAVWIFVVGLHWENNGLWFQGDASRHAANGLFWQSYLASPTLDVKAYALSYYARYPVINPIAYPPFFYLLEAVAYRVFGPSAFVAKNLVLSFALIAALYLSAWLRRWVSPRVGWSAALLLLLPGVLKYSHAVMLNIPALTLTVASVYHARRWSESGRPSMRSGHLHLSLILGILTILTYYPAGSVLFVLIVVTCAGGAWRYLARGRTLLLVLASALLLVPLYFILARWMPGQMTALVHQSARMMWNPLSWKYYLKYLPILFGWTTLILASMSWVAGLLSRRWRRETLLVSAWLVVTYSVFSIVSFKDSRYILSLAAPVICLCAVGLAWSADQLSRMTAGRRQVLQVVSALGVFLVVGSQVRIAVKTSVPEVSGFAEIAAFLKEVAPKEPVFYDGATYNGLFTFHIQANDPRRERRVVLGNKLLYAYSMQPGSRQIEFVSSAEDVVEKLRTEGGCRWLAIERGEPSERSPAMRYLREALEGPEFELVRSFPIIGRNAERVDLYRMSGPISPQRRVRLPFPYVSKTTVFEVEPIAPRTSASTPASL